VPELIQEEARRGRKPKQVFGSVCGNCRYFMLLVPSVRRGNAWGWCRHHRCTVGRKGRCEDFKPAPTIAEGARGSVR